MALGNNNNNENPILTPMTIPPRESVSKVWQSRSALILTLAGVILAWLSHGSLHAETPESPSVKPAGPPTETIPPPIPDAPAPVPAPGPPPALRNKPLNPLPPGEAPPVQPISKITETQFKMGEIEFDTKERTLTFPAKVNMNQGNLEYLLVADHGKVHEALLATPVQPFYLNVVFLLMKFEKAENFFPDLQEPSKKLPKPVLKDTNSFECKLSWKDQEGKVQSALLTDWIQNNLTKKPVPRTRWVYTGSVVDGNGSFLSQLEGSILACYTDPVSMINSPLDGNDNDEIWVPAPKVPPVDTSVQITFFPFRDKEAKDLPDKK